MNKVFSAVSTWNLLVGPIILVGLFTSPKGLFSTEFLVAVSAIQGAAIWEAVYRLMYTRGRGQ